MSKTINKKDQKTPVKKAKIEKKELKEKEAVSKKSFITPNESVKITLKWTVVEPIYKKTVNHFAKSVKAEGFRIGKAPFAIVEKNVGSEKIINQVLRELLPQAYEAAIKQDNKKPITTPEFNPISLEKGKDWILEAYFSPIPEVKLGDYKKIIQKAKKEAAAFITKRNEEIKKEAAACENKEKNHDHEHAHQALGENEIREINLQHIFKGLVDEFAPAIGELLLRQETQTEYEKLVDQLKQYKISTQDYLTRRQITIEQLSQELAGQVLSRLQLDFIIAAISQAEKLTIEDKEVTDELDKLTDQNIRQELAKNQNYLNQIKANLLQRKTLDLLLKL